MAKKYGLSDNQVRVFNRLIRTSAQKLNLIAGQIRGLSAGKAIEVMTMSKKRASEDVRKSLLSGVANAENNRKLSADSLIVKEAWVGKAITMKRIFPAKQGSARPILKKFSSLTLVLESAEPKAAAEKPAKKAAKKEDK
ncbi:MAG: 50S ribosomal protein L22 [Rickettsiales bacterium]|jgi:large subunit ribosomal protein L22|nr:50S ribosomal protein L22 [Rickettsiales bacterium]